MAESESAANESIVKTVRDVLADAFERLTPETPPATEYLLDDDSGD